jgi:4-hydroxy-tetrahydrodipicolinate synthase
MRAGDARIRKSVERLAGYAPAVPTPFNHDGTIDRSAFEQFCDLQIKAGATALVVCGTTGEAPTLSRAEHSGLIRIAAIAAHGRVPIIAGAGSSSTAHAIELARHAEAAGAAAVLSVVPYYNRPTQLGLDAHFRAIANASGLPLFLYDVPSRTACRLADETVARLAELPRIIGLKDATGDVTRPMRLRALLGADFRLLSGDDAAALPFFAQGGNGCISVTSNILPGLCRRMFRQWQTERMSEAQASAKSMERLTTVLFRETSPAPLKHALGLLGLMSPKLRLPLVEPTEQTKREIEAALEEIQAQCPRSLIGNLDCTTDKARAIAS